MANKSDGKFVFVNTRAEQMWSYISQVVDFDDKTVIDLGCGYGDFLWLAWQAGARRIYGIDNDANVASKTFSKLYRHSNIHVMLCRIEDYLELSRQICDVMFCFSVLPYLCDMSSVLLSINDHSRTAFIECQYAGDGPGPTWIWNDLDMAEVLLSAGFANVERIGRTEVVGRDVWRTIWKCGE